MALPDNVGIQSNSVEHNYVILQHKCVSWQFYSVEHNHFIFHLKCFCCLHHACAWSIYLRDICYEYFQDYSNEYFRHYFNICVYFAVSDFPALSQAPAESSVVNFVELHKVLQIWLIRSGDILVMLFNCIKFNNIKITDTTDHQLFKLTLHPENVLLW